METHRHKTKLGGINYKKREQQTNKNKKIGEMAKAFFL